LGVLLGLAGVSYVLGAIPTAVWLSRALWGQDIRTLGSKNAGSTNMYRVWGFRAGFPVQVVDIAKGSLAAALPTLPPASEWLGASPEGASQAVAQLVCGLAAVVGHIYTVFAGFKGGKGVNTILGMMLVVATWGSLVGVGVFVLVLLAGKMVSLASMCAVASFPVFLLVQAALRGGLDARNQLLLGVGILLAAGVVYTHRANIARIRAGTESKAGFLTRKKSSPAT
jgi:glycerol-3-phosphate acyltransferase PlsY